MRPRISRSSAPAIAPARPETSLLTSAICSTGPVALARQGPIADALTHVGQLAILRRMASAPVKGEDYFKADIAAGRVGSEQSVPRREFD